MLTPFKSQDFDCLHEFMRPLWHEVYGPILPPVQIDFLLEKYFSAKGLNDYLAQGYEYFWIEDNGAHIGVLAIQEREREIYLDKLYLLPDARGKGYPEQVFSALLQRKKDILLNVNQANERAVNCYRKHGFFIDEVTDIPLGNGMVNKDFVMRKKTE